MPTLPSPPPSPGWPLLLTCVCVLQGDNWNDLLKEVITFESVEEFWGVYVGFYPTSAPPPPPPLSLNLLPLIVAMC